MLILCFLIIITLLAGIYIHIPFCKQACHYCDFHFSTSLSLKEKFLEAIETEISLQKEYLYNETVETIYFGGGTPSLLSSSEISKQLEQLRSTFVINENTEVTLEANPDDLSRTKLEDLYSAGINRLSIGIQSFDNNILTYLNRAHNAVEAFECVEQARMIGFENISIDLIYAIKEDNHKRWQRDLEKCLSLHPEHISAYSLTIEEKTAFGNWLNKGKISVVNDAFAVDEYNMLCEALGENGYDHYEVSNFSLPGLASKHNSNYWRQQKYLGLGPSAHSYNQISRHFNISNNNLYIKALIRQELPNEIEYLAVEDQINEYLLTGLRTSWGCEIDKLKDYGLDVLTQHKKYIEELESRKMIILENNCMRLTEKGLLMADKIASDMFIV
ncbi:MAG: radical SAM family heme chaperone HemW [Bacteroidota bacterium]